VEPENYERWKGIRDGSKSVTFFRGTLQGCDPAQMCTPDGVSEIERLGRVGYMPAAEDDDGGFDVIWCQWCLGHLNDANLLAFFRRSRAALRKREDGKSVIVVKENVCREAEDGEPRVLFDDRDSSITRCDQGFPQIHVSL
jgi:protein N-terminal methyltransferase